jgi:hypothetical protein
MLAVTGSTQIPIDKREHDPLDGMWASKLDGGELLTMSTLAAVAGAKERCNY